MFRQQYQEGRKPALTSIQVSTLTKQLLTRRFRFLAVRHGVKIECCQIDAKCYPKTCNQIYMQLPYLKLISLEFRGEARLFSSDPHVRARIFTTWQKLSPWDVSRTTSHSSYGSLNFGASQELRPRESS